MSASVETRTWCRIKRNVLKHRLQVLHTDQTPIRQRRQELVNIISNSFELGNAEAETAVNGLFARWNRALGHNIRIPRHAATA